MKICYLLFQALPFWRHIFPFTHILEATKRFSSYSEISEGKTYRVEGPFENLRCPVNDKTKIFVMTQTALLPDISLQQSHIYPS